MKFKNATILLLAGIAAGAIAGLLLAPDEGVKTRKKLFKKAKKYKGMIEDKASEFKERASEFREKASDLKDNIEKAAGDVKKRFS